MPDVGVCRSSNQFARLRWSPHGILLGSLLLSLLYLPTLTARFDFIDDSLLVYPTKDVSFDQRMAVVWEKTVANYECLGAFRPLAWLHWEMAATLFQDNDLGRRIGRMAWCMLSAAMFLWLCTELGIPPIASLLAGAIGMSSPCRNEVWITLAPTEGMAMPYALLGLICARRAARSNRSLIWDAVGFCCVLTAIGCKNTFAALVPAQMFLRMTSDDLSWREGLRRHGLRAALLSLSLLAPIIHLALFQMNWRPGQYRPGALTMANLGQYLYTLTRALSLDFVGAGIFAAVLAQIVARRAGRADDHATTTHSATHAAPADGLREIIEKYRAALGAGFLLAICGILIYWPMGTAAGRYSIPAVWGLDIGLAVLFGGLAAIPRTRWRTAAEVALAVGILVTMISNVNKQQRFAARANMLWQALETVEREAPQGSRIAWFSSPGPPGGLALDEAIHFQGHLIARGRRDLRFDMFDEQGRPWPNPSAPPGDQAASFAVWDPARFTDTAQWNAPRTFVAAYKFGLKQHACCLATRRPNDAQTARATGDTSRPVR